MFLFADGPCISHAISGAVTGGLFSLPRCVLVMVGANKSRFKPTVKAIMERYYKKYRGKGGIEPGEADDPLLSGGAGPSSSADAPAPAPA